MAIELIPVGAVTISLGIAPIFALLGGIAILIWPRFLNYIVAGYLIAVGLIGVLNL